MPVSSTELTDALRTAYKQYEKASIFLRQWQDRRLRKQKSYIKKELAAMRAKPLNDRVLVKRSEEDDAVKGGIIIPDTAKEKPMKGEVVAVGPGKRRDDGKRSPLDIKTGDRILFGKYSGTEIKLEDQDYLILREEEILAVLEKKT